MKIFLTLVLILFAAPCYAERGEVETLISKARRGGGEGLDCFLSNIKRMRCLINKWNLFCNFVIN